MDRYRIDPQISTLPAAFRHFVACPEGRIAVGHLPEAVRAAFGARTGEVLLSAETMAKQKRHHPDLTADDYLLLPLLLSWPDVAVAQAGRRAALLRVGRKTLRAAVKTTIDRRESYLISLHYMGEAALRRFLRDAALLSCMPRNLPP